MTDATPTRDERPRFWPYFPQLGERVIYHGKDGDQLGTVIDVAYHDGDVRIALDERPDLYAYDVKVGLGLHTFVPLNPSFQVWWTWSMNACTHRVASFMEQCERCGRAIEPYEGWKR